MLQLVVGASSAPAELSDHPAERVARKPSATLALRAADNLADASTAILKCYHPTASYRHAQIIQGPWSRQGEFGAQRSIVIQIDYEGLAGVPHVMAAALMVRPDSVRTFIVDDRNDIRPNKKCELEKWVAAAAPTAPASQMKRDPS
jgi:hypothetical protein